MTATAKQAFANMITTSEIADLAGVERSTVSNWKKRYAEDFPKPVYEFAGNDVYDRSAIIAWLQGNARRRLDQARRVLKEAKDSVVKAEGSVQDLQSMYDRVKRLRK